MRGMAWLETLIKDVLYGLRQMGQSPGFTGVAVMTLALGIGANTVVFSSIDAMLLHPFAVRDLDRVVAVWETIPKQNLNHTSVAPANFFAWNSENGTFTQLAASHGWDVNLTGSGIAERAEGYQITQDFFSLLGVAPELGRSIGAGDFVPGRGSVIVVSHGFWARRLGGDSHVIGRALLANGENFTVIGVMPAEFDLPVGADLWAPFDATSKEKVDRGDHYLQVIGRLKPGVSASLAEADLNAIAVRLAREYPATNAGHGVRVLNLVKDLTFGSQQFLSVLMGAALFVLLLACANVANLHLARGSTRTKELALRLALGATRWQIVRQLLTESTLTGAAGGAVGLLLAKWGVGLSRRALPPFIVQHVPGLKHFAIDWRVAVFTLLMALAAGMLAGLAPALQASRPDVQEALKEGTRGASSAPAQNRLRSVFVIAEVVLALVLLVGAAGMVRCFRGLLNADLGFDRSHVLAFHISLSGSSYRDKTRVREFYRAVVEKLVELPRVESAGMTTSVPSDWTWNQTTYRGEGQPPLEPGQMRVAISQFVTPGFFPALRVPLQEGRLLQAQDGLQSAPVVVISRSLARRIWPHQDAVGKHIRLGPESDHEPWRTVVGVVGDVAPSSFDTELHPTAYVPFAQAPQASSAVVVRVAGDPLSIAAAARASIRRVDPNEPPYDMRTLEQMISDNLSGVESSANMMSAFGVVALALAAAGIFALMAFFVSQRTHEIGVRVALGAEQADILRLVLGRAIKLAAIGLVIGLPCAVALTRGMSAVLFGMVHLSIVSLAALTLLLAFVAVLAAYLPARRAVRIDPIEALRYE
jgi:predicted permease